MIESPAPAFQVDVLRPYPRSLLVVGGDGADRLYGGTGNDVVDAYDYSGGDTVDCGEGEGDFVFFNPGDNLENCENHSARWFVLQDTA